MNKTFADMLDELLDARAELEKAHGVSSMNKVHELEDEVSRLKTELNDSVVTKSWLYDFLTNSADDKQRGAGA